MKAVQKRKTILFLLLAVLASCFSGCSRSGQGTGQIYLYGEKHAVDSFYEKECELWSAHYHEDGMRDLFLEAPYYYAEFLNIWMHADDDTILMELYQDGVGTMSHNPSQLDFFRRIKSECPETIFHGTDVGHAHEAPGRRYLDYLESIGQEESEQYSRTQEVIEQGLIFGLDQDQNSAYRENKMVENFIWEMERLEHADIMVIYGLAHTELDRMDYWGSNTVPTLATQLREKYGDALHITYVSSVMEPVRTDTLTIAGKEYTAQYYGRQTLVPPPDGAGNAVLYLDYWLVEDAYEDFKDNTKYYDAEKTYCTSFPMEITEGQVCAIRYTRADGIELHAYYRCDGLETPERGLYADRFMVN